MGISVLANAADTTYYTSTNASGSSMAAVLIILAVVIVIIIAGLWKTFQKAKQPGWAAIIPIYNLYIMLKIAGRPTWWLLLYLIPLVNIVTHIVVAIDIAKAFGKTPAFGVIGLWLFSFIGYIMLGFGDTKFVGTPKHP
ncbi:MAG TPA: DUF5684 domain-containing protein [Candidatus Saccharimonadales bacterium]|nr:DUF5684 domain-containing protein [Candidatus Saccharimonadales bacterium]